LIQQNQILKPKNQIIMKIFLHYVKSKPYKVSHILAGDPAKPSDKKNNKIGIYEPKAEGKPEKLELDINKYDNLILSGAKATKTAEKLRMTISPPPPTLETAPDSASAPAEADA
jgi:ribosomal protein S16